jgi:hypothetical protein
MFCVMEELICGWALLFSAPLGTLKKQQSSQKQMIAVFLI